MDDFDIAQSKIGESAQRVVDRAVEESRRRDHALVTNEHLFLAFAQVEWDTFSAGHARPRAEPARDSPGARGAPAQCCRRSRDARAARGAGDEAACSSSRSITRAAPAARRSSRPTCSRRIFEESQGVPVSHHPPPRRRAGGAGVAHRHPDARQRAARRAAAQALRAAAVPEALRDQPESARAPGQDRRRSTAATTRFSRCSRSSATASGRTR